MPFDPFGLREYHENVTRRIRDKEPGLAQSWIGDSLGGALVSLEAGRLAGGPTHANLTEVMDELMLDVARGEGAATSGAFSLKRIELMIENRERWYDGEREGLGGSAVSAAGQPARVVLLSIGVLRACRSPTNFNWKRVATEGAMRMCMRLIALSR